MKLFLFIFFLSTLLFSYNSKYELGEKIYLRTCISCHGIKGVPVSDLQLVVRPRNLKDTILNEEQTYQIIKHGTHYWGSSSDMMPAFKYVYNEKQLRAVAHYISKEFNPNIEQKIKKLYAQSDTIPKQKKSKMFKRGKKIYKRNCRWCHGLDAKGDGEATRNPEKSIYPYNLTKTLLTTKQIFLYTKHGGKFWGTDKDDMPNWSRKYDDYTLKSVVKYIDETFRKAKK